MRILFMDTYFPGFFRFLVPYVANQLKNDEKNEIIFLSEHKRRDYSISGVRHVSIRYPKVPSTYPIAEQITLNAVHQIEAFAHAMQQLKKNGFYPDIIIATEPCSAEIINIFPHACRVVYFDLYYNSLVDDILISKGKLASAQKKPMHLRNAFQLSSMLGCHCAIVPSRLQKESFPPLFQDKMSVLPMGIDAEFFNVKHSEVQREDSLSALRPELAALLECPELITYSSRNPNEYAGFSTVCQAIPRILAARPKSVAVLVTQNVQLAMEHPDCAKLMKIAHGRVHLLGQFTWNEYCVLLQKSAAHIYMSARPPLPTSLIEAMCCGALLIASDTRPVRDIVDHKVHGLLADFFNPVAIGDAVINALELSPKEKAKIQKNARTFAMQNYSAQKLIPLHYKKILECYEAMETEPIDAKKQL